MNQITVLYVYILNFKLNILTNIQTKLFLQLMLILGKHELNELNVPSHNRQQQAWSLQIISQVGCFICDLTSQLSDFHTYTEQRLHAISDKLSPVATKVRGLLLYKSLSTVLHTYVTVIKQAKSSGGGSLPGIILADSGLTL